MPYEMNEGGFLNGGFIADQYNRNEDWADMRRANALEESRWRQARLQQEMEYSDMQAANAAAESYWRQLKMQQEIEREANLNNVSSALTEGMVPLSADVDEQGRRRVHLGYPKDAKPGKDYQPITFADGTAGGFDKTTGLYYDAQGNLVTDASRYTRPVATPKNYQPFTFADNTTGSFDTTTGQYYDALGNLVTDPTKYQRPQRPYQDPDVANANRLSREAAMADIRSVLSSTSEATAQEKADARASLRLMAQTGRVGMIETTPADVTEIPESGAWWWKKPAQTITNAPAMVTTNWYDQVLGSAPTNGVPANLNITPPLTSSTNDWIEVAPGVRVRRKN